MNDILIVRQIRLPYIADNTTKATAVIVVNREDEPYDYVAESARWLYRTLKGVLLPQYKKLNNKDFDYWFRISAREFSDRPLCSDYCWTTMVNDHVSVMDNCEHCPEATIWYSYLRGEIARGPDYRKADKISVANFLAMGEDRAVAWANAYCPKKVGKVYESFSEYDQERIL